MQHIGSNATVNNNYSQISSFKIRTTNTLYEAMLSFVTTKTRRLSNTHTPYLLTIRIKPLLNRLNANEHQSQYAFRQYNNFYQAICSHLVNNYTKPNKLRLLPKSFDFLDDPESKHSNVYTFNTTPHIHSLFYVRRTQVIEFNKLISDNCSAFKASNFRHLRNIESIHAEPIRCGTEAFVLAYASKLLKNPIHKTTDLYNINPHNPR